MIQKVKDIIKLSHELSTLQIHNKNDLRSEMFS